MVNLLTSSGVDLLTTFLVGISLCQICRRFNDIKRALRAGPIDDEKTEGLTTKLTILTGATLTVLGGSFWAQGNYPISLEILRGGLGISFFLFMLVLLLATEAEKVWHLVVAVVIFPVAGIFFLVPTFILIAGVASQTTSIIMGVIVLALIVWAVSDIAASVRNTIVFLRESFTHEGGSG